METTTPRLQPGMLITIKDVQAALSCKSAKAWGLIRDGHLEVVRFGRRMTRIKSDSVIALMERGI